MLNSNEKEYIKCQQFLVVIISLPYEIITQQFKRYVKTLSEIFYSIFMLIVYHWVKKETKQSYQQFSYTFWKDQQRKKRKQK